jgi:exonuclease SbcD
MGHIHSCQAVGRETCRYSGSLLKYSLNSREINSEKTIPVITMSEKNDVKVELHKIEPLREVRHIKGALQDLIKNAVDTDDYIYATLTDEETQLDAMARMQEVYPHIMKLDYDNSSTRAIADSEEYFDTEGKSFDQLIADFFQLYHGQEPGEKDWELIEDVAREAGVIQ